MANRRMFSLDVVDTDQFLDMPATSQNLYFHLGVRADDDGFVSNPKKITKLVNCANDDLNVLISRGFVILMDGGIIVIRHWRQNNYIQRDRYKTTIYQKQLAALSVNNGVYEVDTSCIQAVSEMEAQVRLDKDSIDKIKNTSYSCAQPTEIDTASPVISLILNDKSLYDVKQKDYEEWITLYPAVDVMQELRKMKGWCDSNPAKRKTRKGIKRFINSWLAREQDKGRAYNPSDRQQIPEPVSYDYPPDYAKDYVPRPDDPFQ